MVKKKHGDLENKSLIVVIFIIRTLLRSHHDTETYPYASLTGIRKYTFV